MPHTVHTALISHTDRTTGDLEPGYRANVANVFDIFLAARLETT